MTGRSDKSADAFRTISEVAKELGLATHVLRFWESKFPQIKPLKRAGGRRYYRPDDVALLRRLQILLHDEGYTIKGVQKLFREEGARKFIDEGSVTEAEDDTQPPVQPTPAVPQASLFDADPQSAPMPSVVPEEESYSTSAYEAVAYSPDLLPDAPEPEPVYDPTQAVTAAPEPIIQKGLNDDQKTILQNVLVELKDMKSQIDKIA